MLLGLSGCYGYGTNREGGDIDFRGETLNLPSDLLGLTSFEQFEDRKTDTVIYGFNKLVSLLLNCNPNTIEILGLDEDQYLIRSSLGQELLDHKQLFLSRRAAASFGHYADAQLRRLQNAIARDTLSQPSREQHILRSVQHTLEDFNRRHETDRENQACIFIDDAVTEGLEKDLNPQMPAIIEFITDECRRQKGISNTAPDDHKHDYTALNECFRAVLGGGRS